MKKLSSIFRDGLCSEKKKSKINRPKSRVGEYVPMKILNQRQRNEREQKIYGAGCRNFWFPFKVRLWGTEVVYLEEGRLLRSFLKIDQG